MNRTRTTNRLTRYYALEAAKDAGLIAAMNGEPWQACPHPLGSDEHAEWIESWRQEVERQGAIASRLRVVEPVEPESIWPTVAAVTFSVAIVAVCVGCVWARFYLR